MGFKGSGMNVANALRGGNPVPMLLQPVDYMSR